MSIRLLKSASYGLITKFDVALAKRFPASRVVNGAAPGEEESAKQLTLEAADRLGDPKLRDSGLCQLVGVAERWKDSAAAQQTLRRADEAGIDLDAITAELEREGVRSFCDSYHALLACIEMKVGRTIPAM